MKLIYIVLTLLLFIATPVFAQTATLRGQVTDESGAIIPGATVKLNGPSGLVKTLTTGSDGSYSFAGLMPGNYTVLASAPDLAWANCWRSFSASSLAWATCWARFSASLGPQPWDRNTTNRLTSSKTIRFINVVLFVRLRDFQQ